MASPEIQVSPDTNEAPIKQEAYIPSFDHRRINAAYDWTSPSDPSNPRNWTLLQRLYTIVTVTLLAFVATFASAIYAPAQSSAASDFGSSSSVLPVLPLALYNLGLAFGPLVGAPLSETYGRRAVFLVATPVFTAFLLGGSFAKDITALTVCRFFAGVFAAPLISNASAVILDCVDSRHRGVSLGMYYAIPSFGSGIGPLVGGFVVQAGGWRWTQWAAVVLAVVCFIPVLFSRETYKKVIIQKRAIRLGLQDTSSQRTSPARAFRYFATVLIQRPLHMLFTEPIVTFVSLYNGFLFGLMYTFIVAIPWIFETVYSFDESAVALTYLGLSLGVLLAAVPLVVVDIKYYQGKRTAWQAAHGDEQVPPEYRLIPAMIGSGVLPVSLVVIAWTAQYRVHWIVPILFQGVLMFASIMVYAGANLFMLDAYGPLYGASASGAMMLSRYLFSATFPLFAVRLFQALGVGWATTLLAGVTVLMAPIPWCFWIYGERIRRRSRYETSS